MPLYDYRCEDCGDFRAMRPMRESAEPADCPECGEAAPRQLVAPYLAGPGFSGGWLSQPAAGRRGGGWRSACGIGGCGHAGC